MNVAVRIEFMKTMKNDGRCKHMSSLELITFYLCVHTGKGNCTGSTVELAFNYIAGETATKQGGMFSSEDIPYNAKIETMGTCDDVTEGKVPLVGIEGWSQLPTNNYQVTMNAIAKVCDLRANIDLREILNLFRCAGCHFAKEPV